MATKVYNPKTGKWEVQGTSQAIQIKILDAENNFESDNVEGALRELATNVSAETDIKISSLESSTSKLKKDINTINSNVDTLKSNYDTLNNKVTRIDNTLTEHIINHPQGGGSTTMPTIKSEFENNSIVSKNEDVYIDIYFTSPNLGSGTAYVIINGIEAKVVTINQGNNQINIGQLSALNNKISIYVKDRGNLTSNQLTWNVICGGLDLDINFDSTADYGVTDTIRMPYTVTSASSEPIILHLKIDYDTYEVEANSGYNEYIFKNLSVGIHKVQVYATSGPYSSETKTFNIVVVNAAALYVSTTFEGGSFEFGSPISINYRVSKLSSETFDIFLYLDNELVKTLNLPVGSYYWTLNNASVGSHNIEIVAKSSEGEEVSVKSSFEVYQGAYTPIQTIKTGLIFQMNALGRTNQDSNRDSLGDLSGNAVTSKIYNLNYSTNGWIDNKLILDGKCYAEINLKPYKDNCKNGSTIDIYYKPLDIGKDDAIIFDYTGEDTPYKGISINLLESTLTSVSNKILVSLEKDEWIRITFVIDRDNKFAKIYLNGVLNSAFYLLDTGSGVNRVYEDFTHDQKIYLNCFKDGTHLGACEFKEINIYNRTLSDDEIVQNYLAGIEDLKEQERQYKFNYQNTTTPVIKMYGDTTNMSGDTAKTMRIKYESPNDELYGQSFDLPYCQVLWQGTSSLAYIRKNYTMYLKDENMADYYYTPFRNGILENVFCLKCDYMESTHSHNTGLAKLFNDCLYDTKNPSQKINENVRNSINGFPILLYINDEFMGAYNFNLDRYSTTSFGYNLVDKCLAYEISANSDVTAGAFHKWTSDSGKSEIDYYRSDFECIYPMNRRQGDDNFAELIRLVNWVNDADDVLFAEQFEEYFNKEYTLRYFLGVYMMGLVDNLGKNTKLVTWDGKIWYFQFYDCDTSLGLDNSGNRRFDVDIEMSDTNVFNTSTSLLWTKILRVFWTDLQIEYAKMRNGNFTLDNIMKYLYEEQICNIPKTVYNSDMQTKYLDFGSSYLYACHGDSSLHMRRWLRERLLYMDTMMGFMNSVSDYITIRVNKLDYINFDIQTYSPCYMKVKFRDEANDTGSITQRIRRGETVRFTGKPATATDQEVILFGGSNIKDLGDISNANPSTMIISNAYRLTKIVCHSEWLISADISALKYLQEVDFENCTKYGTETQKSLIVNNCNYITKINAKNTSLTTIQTNLSGGNLEEIYYPNTVTEINIGNQKNLKVLGIPYGNNGENAPKNLSKVTLNNCPNIEKLNDSDDIEVSKTFNAFKYVQELYLTNSTKLTAMNFKGFNKIKIVELYAISSLASLGFDDMVASNETSTLQRVKVSGCPLIKTLTMNVSDETYKIAFSTDNKVIPTLDLSEATSIEQIISNYPIQGLNKIILPKSIKDLRFTNEFNINKVCNIKNIWSYAAVHENDNFEGLDLIDLNIKNIDMSSLLYISNAINFKISPTDVNPNFNTGRDGINYNYFNPNGAVDLTNYTGSLARFFNGINLDKLQIIVNGNLPQTDLSYCFYNSTFSNKSVLLPILNNLVEITNLDYCFYKTSVNSVDVLNNVNLSSYNCTMRYTFAECQNITKLIDFEIPDVVSNAEGMLSGNANLKTITNIIINTPIASKLFKGCTQLTSISGNITSPTMDSLFEDCYKLNDISNFNINVAPINLTAFVKGTKELKTLSFENINLAQNVYFDEMCMNSGLTMLKMRGQLGVRKSTWYNFISGTNNLYVDMSNSTLISNNFNNKNNFSGGNNFTVDFSNTNLSQYATFKEYFANGGIKKLIIDGTKFNVSGVSFENMCMNCTKLIEDVLFPANYVTNVTNCYSGCTGLKTVHSNWKQTYGKSGFVYDNCYAGCTGIYTIDGVVVVNEYSTGLDEVPVRWGGYGMDSTVCGIYELTFTETDANDEPTTVVYETKWQSYPNGASSKRVNWGDGTITEDGSTTHTYVSPGVYIIKGNIALGTSQGLTDSTKKHLTKVIQHPSSVQPVYTGCSKLNYAKLRNNFANVTKVFEGCTLLESLDISESNFENCSNYSGFLNGCKQLRKDGIIGFDNLQFRGSIESTFQGCTNFGDWSFILEKDFSEVTSLQSTFQYSSFDIEDISSASFNNVTNYTLAFAGTPITQHHVKFSNKVRMLDRTYMNCTNLTKVTMTSDSDLSNVYRRSAMFAGCTNLIEEFDFSTINTDIANGTGHNTELSPGYPNSDVYGNCTKLTTIEKFKCINYYSYYSGSYGQMSSSPIGGCSNLRVFKEFDVSFTKSYPVSNMIYINNDYWISVGWKWFYNLNNLQEIGFKGEVYSSDDFTDYRILRGCKTQNFTAGTWQSFVDIFPDNSSSGIVKSVCVGTNIAHIPETYANLLTSKGYTLYAANS